MFGRYLWGKLLRAVVTLIAVTITIFALARISGNPADIMLSPDATPDDRLQLIERLGLNRPMLEQYVAYLSQTLIGDFGTSLRTGRPVEELVGDRLINSLVLASASILVAVTLSIPLGVLAATHRGKLWDRFAMALALLGQSVPSFLSGILAILVFSVYLGWFPTSGKGGAEHLVLPAVTLGWFTSAGIVRLLRSAMLEVLDTEYVKLARIKGLSESRVVWYHAFRNALIPVVTFVGFMYGVILAASVATEVVFNYPGLGRLAYEATLWRDYPLLQFTVLVWAFVIVSVNLAVDLIYAALDPRIRT